MSEFCSSVSVFYTCKKVSHVLDESVFVSDGCVSRHYFLNHQCFVFVRFSAVTHVKPTNGLLLDAFLMEHEAELHRILLG
jgi:hypothetical protein